MDIDSKWSFADLKMRNKRSSRHEMDWHRIMLVSCQLVPMTLSGLRQMPDFRNFPPSSEIDLAKHQ